MKEFIKETLVNIHRTCTTDQYGQVHIRNFTPNVFGARKDEVLAFCKKYGGILQFGSYGGSYGIYTAFTIVDSDIRRECENVLRNENENYHRNMTTW